MYAVPLQLPQHAPYRWVIFGDAMSWTPSRYRRCSVRSSNGVSPNVGQQSRKDSSSPTQSAPHEPWSTVPSQRSP